MRTEHDYAKFILVTDYNDSGEDLLVHCYQLTERQLAAALKKKGQSFSECYAVPEDDIGYYCYEPMFLTIATENNIIKIANS